MTTKEQLISMTALMSGPIMEAIKKRGQSDDERMIIERSAAMLATVQGTLDGKGATATDAELEMLLDVRRRGLDSARTPPADLFGDTSVTLGRCTNVLVQNGFAPPSEFERRRSITTWASLGALGDALEVLVVTMAGDGEPAYSEGIRLRAARDLADMRMTGGWKVLFDGTSPYYVPSNPFAAGPSEYPTDPFVVVNRNGKFLLPEELPRIGI
ncbi:hypothetical protein A2348_05015 [Candidatus Uhrbacteria bacterium RIFOXYB12_FULL_58_10]|uniref:Uncharacterized protein n=1 Tax=Candidatus Uhrbacteria bacterium RIFOXYB2_FULL_57_15 TaxID=1802422 RepID=A0A1F7W7S4_9BACT|nr:MAG: hypothetical protein A2348_05015 [Candidatus Uhrbacteria bacterium RIFOXYB12_FULL_58_10]OGL98829.1 MAG: hypothetical protein A2304_05035 [Candidatus Uhrbacteria bacterium RIFOXYB2_FULL_57_15]OGM00296.1 MAG: hypothetical protein A2501_02065 [Candidatus Uhrbacteria bacterium RIFOXYC12_FULL_57_11]